MTHDLHHIGLELEPRFERKSVLIGHSLTSVLASIQMSPAIFRPTFPKRTIQNLYLDSETFEAWRRHIEGSPYRSKFRIRWYGNQSYTASPLILEQKIKWGQTGTKNKTEIGEVGSELLPSLEHSFNLATLPDVLAEQCQGLKPSLYNRYDRQYFLSFDQSVRLTIDTHLTFARPTQMAAPIHLKEHIVIEYKYRMSHEKQAQRHLSFFPWRLTKNSKYITGMNLLY